MDGEICLVTAGTLGIAYHTALAEFSLTHLLLETLEASPSAREGNISSDSHYNKQLDFNDLQMARLCQPMRAYGRSKLAEVLSSYGHAHRLHGTQVTSNALSPDIVATEIWKKVQRYLNWLMDPLVQRVGKPPLDGAQTSIYLATSPEVEGVTGKYSSNKQPVSSSTISYDPVAARRSWDISLQLVSLTHSSVVQQS